MPIESSSEQDLASSLSAVSVSLTRQTRFVFGSWLSDMASLQPPAGSPLELYARTGIGRLEEQAKKLTEDRNVDRQDMHYLQEQVQGATIPGK